MSEPARVPDEPIEGEEVDEQPKAMVPSALPASLSKFIDEGMNESLLRRAVGIKFKGKPMDVVVRSLDMANRYGLDPMNDEVEIIETWDSNIGAKTLKPFITLKGYLKIAEQHPDYIGPGACGFTYENGPDGTSIVRCELYLKRLKRGQVIDVGPFSARKEVFIQKRNANPGDKARANEFAEETAYARALRRGLRFTFGLVLPEESDTDGPWRDDQRKFLHKVANNQGWDADARHRAAAAVLGRSVTTWSTLTEADATQLQIAWQHLIDIEPRKEEQLPGFPHEPSRSSAPPSEPDSPIGSTSSDVTHETSVNDGPPKQTDTSSPAPERVASPDAVKPPKARPQRVGGKPATATPAERAQDDETRRALLARMDEIATAFEWNETTRLARAGGNEWTKLPTSHLQMIADKWQESLDHHFENRRSRLASVCGVRQVDLQERLGLRKLDDLSIAELEAEIAAVAALPEVESLEDSLPTGEDDPAEWAALSARYDEAATAAFRSPKIRAAFELGVLRARGVADIAEASIADFETLIAALPQKEETQ